MIAQYRRHMIHIAPGFVKEIAHHMNKAGGKAVQYGEHKRPEFCQLPVLSKLRSLALPVLHPLVSCF
jgi:hypothetical protein